MSEFKENFVRYFVERVNYDEEVTDPRERPRIELGIILSGVSVLSPTGSENVFQMDQNFRCSSIRKELGDSCADSTIFRVADGLERDEVRQVNSSICHRGDDRYKLGDKKLRIGIVDGTMMSNRYLSAFQLVHSEDKRFLKDLEPYDDNQYGKELVATERLLDRELHSHDDGYYDLIMGDGLYVSQHHFRQCLNRETDVLVKTRDKTLNVVADADQVFEHYPYLEEGVEHVEGVDAERDVNYEVHASGNFSMDGVDVPVKVARVVENEIGSDDEDESEEFFVLTTRDDLNAEELRELAHLRWSIENNGFKLLNSLCNSKHEFTKKEEACFNLIFLIWIGFNMLLWFLAEFWSQIEQNFAGARLTIEFARKIVSRIIFSVVSVTENGA